MSRKKWFIIFLCFILGICSINFYKKQTTFISENLTQKETEQENITMRREFCTVQDIKDDYMFIKNTKSELYRIDNSLNTGFTVGSELVLVYSDRKEIETNIYEATVHSIQPDDSTIQQPFN